MFNFLNSLGIMMIVTLSGMNSNLKKEVSGFQNHRLGPCKKLLP